MRRKVRVGTPVVAPLSGHPRLGIVIATEAEDDNAREDLREVVEGLSLLPDLVELCEWASEAAAVPLPVVLRGALPPGLNTSRYRILEPAPDWPWKKDDHVARTALKRVLEPGQLRAAEMEGRILLAPAPPERATVEWAVAEGRSSPDLSRAPRQRRLFELLKEHRDGYPTSVLLTEAGAARSSLRELVRKGAVRLVRHPQPVPVLAAHGDGALGELEPFLQVAKPAVRRGGAFVWRIPGREQRDAVAAVARATVEGGERTLVLAPEIEVVERLVRRLRRALPAGRTVAPYHSGLGGGLLEHV